MKLVFTRSQLPLSKLIRWGLKEPVSHVAIVFDDKLVFQSNLLGVGIEGIYRFHAAAEFVETIEIEMSAGIEEAIYMNLLQKYDGRSYDFKAFAYFSYRAVLYRLFKTPYPPKNEWGDPNAFLCDGLLAALLDTPNLPEWFHAALTELGDIEIRSPYQVMLAIDKAQLENHYPTNKG